MFRWFNRRDRIRRDDDLRLRMEKAIHEKQMVSFEALERMKQFIPERRSHSIPVEMERRKA